MPESWRDCPVYLSFEGADDHYELYVNGELAGSGGDIATKQTAFEQRKSHDVTRFVTPGAAVQIAVRVVDWQGAGGLFRPITLGTSRIDPAADVLK